MNRIHGLRLAIAGLVTAGLMIAGCAPYNQLKPKPELAGAEGTYTPLKRGEDDFEMKKKGRYYIAFPAPQADNSYIVLNMPNKKRVTSFFTDKLIDEKKPGARIADESPFPDTQSVFPIGTGVPTYYWIADAVPADVVMKMTYRYVPRWRFKFETRHGALSEQLKKNLVNRTLYTAIAPGYSLENVDFVLARDSIIKHTTALEQARADLEEASKLFPQNVINSQDAALKSYTTLKGQLDEEIAFQKAFSLTMDFFYKEQQTRRSALEFVTRMDDFIAFFQRKAETTDGIQQAAIQVMKKRLGEVIPFFDQRLAEKADTKPFEPDFWRLPEYNKVPAMCETAGITIAPDFSQQHRFMNEFDTKARAALAVRDSIGLIAAYVKDSPQMPTDEFFAAVVTRSSAVQAMAPQPIDGSHGKYQGFTCAQKLNGELAALGTDVVKVVEGYRAAQGMVPQLNALKAQKDYSGMLGILKTNAQLAFLTDKYRDLDKMSITEQANAVRGSLEQQAWSLAENTLRKLHADQNFLNPSSLAQKAAVVEDLEDTLYIRIERVTRNRVMKFLDERVNQLTNIDSLYVDSAWVPVYDVTFSSGGKKELLQRKEQLIADLAKFKENEFPMRAVKLMYEQFLKNPIDSGVYRARAIVAHGKHYTGEDKDTKIRIAECDPTLAKWITQPKDYRRVFALPVTDNEGRGKNKYMVRLNVRIATDAQFPVYDVNIKLPKELAENAASEQWYDAIKLNKKELKNEGRFSITAPTASNNYECQATPVQMDKDGNNIFEITFTANGFKVFPVSVMVQKPIIKKN